MEKEAPSGIASVTIWLQQLKAGDRTQAVEELWRQYYVRLVELARKHLAARSRQVADEEDAALSAFDSFVRAAQAGRFPRLNDRDDLWQVLFIITARKVSDLRTAATRQKRGGGLAVHSLADNAALPSVSPEPDPAEAVELAEEADRMLQMLGEPLLRQIAIWKLEGFTTVEIAGKLGRSVPTVERKLRRIRVAWQAIV